MQITKVHIGYSDSGWHQRIYGDKGRTFEGEFAVEVASAYLLDLAKHEENDSIGGEKTDVTVTFGDEGVITLSHILYHPNQVGRHGVSSTDTDIRQHLRDFARMVINTPEFHRGRDVDTMAKLKLIAEGGIQ